MTSSEVIPPTERIVLDDVDRRLLAALAVDGRGSWAHLAAGSGCSVSTVQRRFARLVDAGVMTVIAAADVLASGLGVSVMTRVQCGPADVGAVVDRLRRRPEVRFATTVSGSTDCVVEFVVPRFADLQALLGELFPEPGVRTEALPVLRTFTVPFASFPGSVAGSSQATPAQPAPPQTRAAVASPPEHAAAHDPAGDDMPNAAVPDLDSSDGVVPVAATATAAERHVLDLLVVDGRLPVTDLARSIGKSETATKRLLQTMIASGRLRVGPLVTPDLLGLDTELMVWISVAPDQLGAAARQLARHGSVHYAAATAGRFNLIGQAFLGGFAEVYDFTTTVLGALPGVREVDVSVQMTTHKRMWTPLVGGRFTRDDTDGDPAD
jgi:DNA-binding Lrp family transcriptional regulator